MNILFNESCILMWTLQWHNFTSDGISPNMFTVLFAIGRAPGWLAHWKEIAASGSRIHRPRQIYQGSNLRSYTALEER